MVATSKGFEFTIDNADLFRRQLDNLGEQTNDFRIPFRLISSDFYRSQRKIFTLKSKGLYQDLAPAIGIDGNNTTTSNYKAAKKRVFGKIYPILEATGVLARSTLKPNAQHSIFFLGRKELQIGTSDPVGRFHQSDSLRKKIPLRKFIFIDGGPADKSSDSAISGRRERWGNIIIEHTLQLIKGSILT